MARPEGVNETKPRAKGAGRKRSVGTYAEHYATDPEGSTPIRLKNSTLEYFERMAKAEGLTVPQYLDRFEINSRIF